MSAAATPDWGTNDKPVSSQDWGGGDKPANVPLGDQPASISGVAKTMTDQAGRFLGAAWENLNPVTIAKSVGGLFTGETEKKAFGATVDALDRFDAAKAKGDWKEAGNAILGAVPLFGPSAEQIAREIEEGKHAEALGHAAGLRLMLESPKAIAAIKDAAPVVKAAVKAGAPDVAMGTAKIGAAAALAETPIPGYVKYAAGAPTAFSGGKQIVQGLRTGIAAGKEAYGKLPKVARPPTAAEKLNAILQGPKLKAPDPNLPAPGSVSEEAAPAGTPAPEPSAPVGPTPEDLDGIAQSLAGKPYDKLTAAGKATVDRVAAQAAPKAAPPVQPAPQAPGPVAVAPNPPPPDIPQAPPPSAPVAPVQPPVTGAPAPYLNPETTGLQIAREQGNRAAIADRIAKQLHAGGVTFADIENQRIVDPQANKLFWNNTGRLPDISSQPHYAPSPETQAQVLIRLKKLEKAAKIAQKMKDMQE